MHPRIFDPLGRYPPDKSALIQASPLAIPNQQNLWNLHTHAGHIESMWFPPSLADFHSPTRILSLAHSSLVNAENEGKAPRNTLTHARTHARHASGNHSARCDQSINHTSTKSLSHLVTPSLTTSYPLNQSITPIQKKEIWSSCSNRSRSVSSRQKFTTSSREKTSQSDPWQGLQEDHYAKRDRAKRFLALLKSLSGGTCMQIVLTMCSLKSRIHGPSRQRLGPRCRTSKTSPGAQPDRTSSRSSRGRFREEPSSSCSAPRRTLRSWG